MPDNYALDDRWLAVCAETLSCRISKKEFSFAGNGTAVLNYSVLLSPLFGRRLVSLPFSDESGILFPAGEPGRPEKAALVKMLGAFLDKEAAGLKLGYAELRGADALSDELEQAGFIKTSPYCRFVLDLKPGYAACRASFGTNILKNLSKAGKHLTIRSPQRCSPEELSAIYAIYLRQMKKFGSPPLPRTYFAAMIRENIYRPFLAEAGGRIAAFLLAIRRGRTFYTDLNASLEEYDALFPKVALFNETIEYACQSGFERYDMMRTRRGGGVYEHKRKWGGSEVPINYYYKLYGLRRPPELDPEKGAYRLAAWALKKAPCWFLAGTGPLIRRAAGK